MPLYTIPVEKALGWTRVESASLQTVSRLSLGAGGITLIGWLIDFLDARTVMAADP